MSTCCSITKSASLLSQVEIVYAMSQIIPAAVNVPENEIVSRWGKFCGTFQEKIFGCTEEVLGSMSKFQSAFRKHLDEITELNSEIARRNAGLAMKLLDFEKDICHIRDYYEIIIASTKTMVEYGCDQSIIPHIRNLIEEKRFPEAKIEIDSFLCHLQKAIKRVKQDIEAMQEDCTDLNTVKSEIQLQSLKLTAGDELIAAKQAQIQASRGRVFRLGTSTLVYTMAGAAAGLVVASCIPQEASKLTDIVTSAGSEVLTFYTGSVLTGLKKLMGNANLSDLNERAESSMKEVTSCLLDFFKQLDHFQSNINTIETTIDKLKRDMVDLQEGVDYDDVHTITVAGWKYVGKILQQMFGSFTRLNACVSDESTEGFSKEEFDGVIKRLTRSVDLTVQGTPV